MTAAVTWWTAGMQRVKQDRWAAALIAAWALAMVSLPILRWQFGDDAIPAGVILTTALQAGAVLVILAGAWGIRRVAFTAALIVAVAWAVEFVGSQTGVPFGVYDYTDRLQPQVGAVPLLIPFAWLMMLPPAWAVAAAITGQASGPRFVAVSALAFTAWDFFLDPQMVAWGFWRWSDPAGYFGIPWVNFLGWFLAAALLTAVARPRPVPVAPLLAIYAITWALEAIGQIAFWDLPGPGVVGFVVMGVPLLAALALRREPFP